jgi:DNA polymerase-1
LIFRPGEKIQLTINIPFWLVWLLRLPVLLYRRLRYGYAFCRIPLTQGQYAIVDPDDYRRLSKYKWHVAGRPGSQYAVSKDAKNTEKPVIYMHREVIKAPDELLADHINRNSLDNRKANLRPATHAQNVQNRTKNRKGKYSSKYKGVNWNRGHRLWQAEIKFNGNCMFLGSFESEIRAAKAYDRAAKRYHGEFAVLNFPERRRRIARIIPFLAGVILTYIAYLTIWPDRQTELINAYQQLTNTFELIDFCHPEPAMHPCHSEHSEESRSYRFCSNVAVPFIPTRLRFFVPLRSTQNDRKGGFAQNDMRGGSVQKDIRGGTAKNDTWRRPTQTHPQVKRKNDKKIGPVQKRPRAERGDDKLRRPAKALHRAKYHRLMTKYQRPTTKSHRPKAAPALTARAQTSKVATMAKILYIIDGHAHIYAAYYAPMGGQLTGPSGEPTKATYIFTTALVGLIQRRKPDLLAVAMDSKTPTFRSDIYPEYKAHRPPMPDDLPGQIDRIEQILEALNVPMLRLDGFEADDIIGTLAKKAGADGYDCLICSKDKDLLQLIDEHISTFDIKTDTLTDTKAMLEKMGVTPEQFIDCLALQGDTSDNVPGVPDVGPKTALGWIQKYGSLEKLYEHVDEIKGKRGDNLRKFKDQAELSRKLVTIDTKVPIDVEYADLELKKFNEQKLKQLFTELGFNRLLAQLDMSADTSPAAQSSPAQPQTTSHESRATNHDYRLIDTQEKFEKFYEELKKQKLIAIDTETTSVDAMRADLVGMSFSWQPEQGFYLAVKAPLGAKHLDIEAVRRKLAPIFADESVKKIGQNIKYDMLVLRNAQMPVKGVHFDTMVASYCLDPSRSHSMNNMAADFLDYKCIPISALIGKGRNQLTFDMVDTAAACEYAAEDADVTYRLYLYLKERLEKEPLIKKLFEGVEMPLVPVLATMEYNGVALDTKVLRKMSGEINETLKKVTEQIYEQTGTVFNLDSPKQLGEVLFNKLGLVPVRGRSTDAGVLEQLSNQHPAIDLILQYRNLSKLQNTYVDKLGSLINPRTGRVHAQFNQTITATGRLSSSNPNLQNIPIRTELGSKVRSAFVPGNKGDCILSADYSQIELRLLAHFSKDKALMEAFAADRDIHSFVASQIYGVPIEQVTSEMRSSCKAVNFGIIYGQGPFGLSRSIGISRAEAKKFIDDYFARYKSIRQFMDDCIASARRTGYAETILHRRRKIQNLHSKNGSKRSQAERLAVNTVVQGSAADLIKLAMISIQRKIDVENLPVLMLLQIHDELLFELLAAEADTHAKWIAELMTRAIKLDVPLKVDINYGPSWLGGK